MKAILGVLMVAAILCMALSVKPIQATMTWDSGCDLDKSGKVDILDVSAVAWAFGSNNLTGTPTPKWNCTCDVFPADKGDCRVNIFDVIWVASHFGTTP